MRKKLLVWSGGLDSTMLLNNLAKDSSKENPVYAFSFDADFIDDRKNEMESQARRNYLAYAQKQGYHIKHEIVSLKATVSPYKTWGQQKSWLSFILPYIPDDCDVYYAYIQGDCIWPAIDNYMKIFQEFKYLGGFQTSCLEFPFCFKEKWQVLKEYQEAEIPQDCFWTCEHPSSKGKIEACGICEPCIHLKMAQIELDCRESVGKEDIVLDRTRVS